MLQEASAGWLALPAASAWVIETEWLPSAKPVRARGELAQDAAGAPSIEQLKVAPSSPLNPMLAARVLTRPEGAPARVGAPGGVASTDQVASAAELVAPSELVWTTENVWSPLAGRSLTLHGEVHDVASAPSREQAKVAPVRPVKLTLAGPRVRQRSGLGDESRRIGSQVGDGDAAVAGVAG